MFLCPRRHLCGPSGKSAIGFAREGATNIYISKLLSCRVFHPTGQVSLGSLPTNGLLGFPPRAAVGSLAAPSSGFVGLCCGAGGAGDVFFFFWGGGCFLVSIYTVVWLYFFGGGGVEILFVSSCKKLTVYI